MPPKPRINGKMIIDGLIPMAEMLGWRVVHFRPARTKYGWTTAMQGKFSKGFPDLLLLRERLVVAEIKGDGDKLRPEQEEWLLAFERAGGESYVWNSKDWMDGAIEKVLR